jgi:hypothetical protein
VGDNGLGMFPVRMHASMFMVIRKVVR